MGKCRAIGVRFLEYNMSENTQENSHYPALNQTTDLIPVRPADDQPLGVRDGHTDDQLMELWVHGRSPHTQRVYRADAKRFLSFTGTPLRQVRLADLQSFAD